MDNGKGARFSGRTALVTGAASGIGRATALALGREGAGLVLCDINEEGLRAVAEELDRAGEGAVLLSRRVDVGSAEQMAALAAEVHGRCGALDILVNNAGVGLGAGLLDSTLEDWRWLLAVNLWGVIHGCHFFVPAMVRRGRGGHVVNVASMAGYAATELLLAYGTSKSAVIGLSEALREELRAHRIGVSAICPGFIDTPILQAARLRGAAEGGRERVAAFYRRRAYGPDRVAAAILGAIRRNRALVPVSPEAWIMYLIKRLSPALAAALGRRTTALVKGG